MSPSEPERIGEGEAGNGWSAAEFFARNAVRWDEIYGRTDVVSIIHQLRLATACDFARRAAVGGGMRALDIGCGAGHMSVWLAEQGLKVCVTDLVPRMLKVTQRRAQDHGLTERIYLSELDAQTLPFRDASFDLIVALGVLPWVESPQRVVAEMRRLLRPGGFVIVNASNRVRLTWLLDPMNNLALEHVRRRIKTALSRLGITLVLNRSHRVNVQTRNEFERSLRLEGLTIVSNRSIGFGPFTLFLQKLLPNSAAVSLHRRLQHLADSDYPVFRSTGAQHIALAMLSGAQRVVT